MHPQYFPLRDFQQILAFSWARNRYPDEYTGDYNELVYLRARYYAPGMGRFLTRDTWAGEAMRPMSYNKWNYVQSSPINYTDPTGHDMQNTEGCGALGYFAPIGAKYADENVKLPKTNWINTYTAAGIAVQCWAAYVNNDDDYDGYGPAQITYKWTSTLYGEWIPNPADPKNKADNRGYGLRCYLPIAFHNLPKEVLVELAKSCIYCFKKDQKQSIGDFDKYYEPEPIYDQNNIEGATIYMRRMMQLIVNECRARGCGDTDIYIAAALAQNGPGFTIYSLKETELQTLPIPDQTKDVKMDWYSWFEGGDPIDNSTQLRRFNQVIKQLTAKNWAVPYIDMTTVNHLINREFPQ